MTQKEADIRAKIKDRQRIVVKIGSSSLHHMQTGELNLTKMERLVRELCELKNQGRDVILVSSGAIAVGRKSVNLVPADNDIPLKQACAAVGQARLMMIYERLFAEYNHLTAQILMTLHTITEETSRKNAQNTFSKLLELGVIPVVNENDTVATHEVEDTFGDNDFLASIVTALTGADLLILLSDIDGMYTDDPHVAKDAKLIHIIEKLDDRYTDMAKSTTGTSLGTGGMNAKLHAAKVATASGADMVIANGKDVSVIHKIMEGRNYGTLFLADPDPDFGVADFIDRRIRASR
ncbi:MAG: glutamate 5-kinase [Lachnospiraceae bacterium]|nr:glutamate 5-kinase [Lachnospiraceae bacterium]